MEASRIGRRFSFAAVLCWVLLHVVASRAADFVQGVVQVGQEALLSSQMVGQVLEMPVPVGGAFRQGDVLVRFSCEVLVAGEDEARAAYSGAMARLANAERLDAARTAGALDLQLARAAAVEAEAKLRSAAARTKLCIVSAPFDGIVLSREAEPHEMVNVLTALLRIAKMGALEIDMIVPAALTRMVKVGGRFVFTTSEGNQSFDGHVIRAAVAIDPGSQTSVIRGRLLVPLGGGLLPGASGSVQFTLPQ